jgi:ribosomal protein L12E/L44/L45/RPP1/RPP2
MDLVAATLVISLFFSLAYMFGERIERLIRNFEITLTVVVILVILAVVGVAFWRRRRRITRAILESADIEIANGPGDGERATATPAAKQAPLPNESDNGRPIEEATSEEEEETSRSSR